MPLASVPVLSLRDRDVDPDAFATAFGESFSRFGFAIVADHGLDPQLPARAVERAKAFFALPEARKREFHIPGGGGQRGYVPFGIEAAKGAAAVDLKEFWHVGRELPDGHRFEAQMPPNVWPSDQPEFRDDVYALFAALDAIGGSLLRSIARYLRLEETFFDAPICDGNSVLRLLHYPPIDAPSDGIRAGAHEDINVITLLLGAEEAGLQLQDRDGAWIDVTPPEGALVINIGDMLQRLTNHRLPSTTHRVRNPAPERAHLSRFSIPFFLHFAPDYLIRTLASCVDADQPDRYPEPITAHDYLYERLREIRLAS